MSTLSSVSTDAEVMAAYDDAASWEEDASTAKAQALITAGRILLRRLAKRSRGGEFEIEIDPAQIRQEIGDARAWLSIHGTGTAGGVIHPDFSNFRT